MRQLFLFAAITFITAILAFSVYFILSPDSEQEIRKAPTMRRVQPEQKKKNPEVWLEKDAQFRLTVRHDLPEKPGYLDLRTLCVPGTPENGLAVYDSYGKKVRIHQYDSLHALLPATPKAETYEIYYGFPDRKPMESWDRGKVQIPNNFRLRQHNVTRRYPNNPKDVWKIEHRRKNTPYSRAKRDLWNAIGSMMTAQADFFSSIASLSVNLAGLEKINGMDYNYAWQMLEYRSQSFVAASSEFLEENYFAPFKNHRVGSNASRIFFTRRPVDTDRNLLTCFSGNLIVPEDGEYEFRLNTNSSRILRLDEKTVFRRLGLFQSTDPNTTGSSDYLTLALKKGAHFIEFLYYKESMATWASLSWRKKGEGKYNLMCDDDFAPAYPVVPLGLENAAREKYPLVLRNDSLALFTGKRESRSMDYISILNARDFSWQWDFNGSMYSDALRYFILNPEKDKLTITPKPDSGFTSFTLPLHTREGEKAPLRPDLALKIWSPYFLYDDEYCSLTLEVSSALPADYTLLLNSAVSRKNPFLPEFSEYIEMPAMPMEHEDRFARSQIVKRYFRVEGQGVGKEPLSADYRLTIPGLEFDSKGIVFAPVTGLSELHTSADGLCDEQNRKVVPILHRMTLHEVRSWELLRKIGSELHKVKRLAVISEDFGDLKERLTEAMKKYSIEVDFISWNKASSPSGSSALETIPAIMKYLKNSQADAAILIPVGANRHGSLGMREEMNATSMVAELLLNQKNMRTVILATPFPPAPVDEEQYSEQTKNLNENLRKLRREKGMRILELSALLKKNPVWNEDFYRTNGEKSIFPLGMTSRIADLIASEIARK